MQVCFHRIGRYFNCCGMLIACRMMAKYKTHFNIRFNSLFMALIFCKSIVFPQI